MTSDHSAVLSKGTRRRTSATSMLRPLPGTGMFHRPRHGPQCEVRGQTSLQDIRASGDSEMAEGSNWEAIQTAAHYKLDNLVGIIDVNRLGQRGETMYGWDVEAYEKRVGSFGWETIIIDGHRFDEILPASKGPGSQGEARDAHRAHCQRERGAPVENQNGWHGKALRKEDVDEAIKLLQPLDTKARGKIAKPQELKPEKPPRCDTGQSEYRPNEAYATRKAYGNALKRPSLSGLPGHGRARRGSE